MAHIILYIINIIMLVKRKCFLRREQIFIYYYYVTVYIYLKKLQENKLILKLWSMK